MSKFRLNIQTWIQAQLRRCNVENIPAFVVARGDEARGGILLKVNHFSKGCELLQAMTDMDGERVWMRLTGDEMVDEKEADDAIRKRRKFDEDLWVIEIEDNDGRFDLVEFLGEPIA